MSRARRLQLQGQPQNWPIETSLRSRFRHALSTFDSADARVIDFGRKSGKRAVPEQHRKTMDTVSGEVNLMHRICLSHQLKCADVDPSTFGLAPAFAFI
jgi:hypothetical protein